VSKNRSRRNWIAISPGLFEIVKSDSERLTSTTIQCHPRRDSPKWSLACCLQPPKKDERTSRLQVPGILLRSIRRIRTLVARFVGIGDLSVTASLPLYFMRRLCDDSLSSHIIEIRSQSHHRVSYGAVHTQPATES
jgi:hypothetical protein